MSDKGPEFTATAILHRSVLCCDLCCHGLCLESRVQGTIHGTISRELAKKLGHETVGFLRAGGYRAPSGRGVDLTAALEASTRGTVEYPPERALHHSPVSGPSPRITVENQSIPVVGRRMAATGPVAGLNFASATSPGGRFLNGALAQEECIARSSGLYACLEHREMYPRHRTVLDAMYSDYVIYSPQVPVFRTDDGALLEQPWTMSVLTCPAVHGKAVRRYIPHREDEIPLVMRARIRKVLAVAAAHGQRRLILGAWGCGAFGLDGDMTAGIFAEALAEQGGGVFDEVVFAITDWSDERRFIGPFERAFS